MLLIDAFNVLHLPEAQRDGRHLELADLAALLGQSRYAGVAAVLVCDGSGDGSIEAPPGRRARVKLAGVEVVFSGPGSNADDEIEERLRRGGGHGVTVVSDDRAVRRAASRVRARVLGSRAFLVHLLAGRPGAAPLPQFARDIPLDRYSVAHWMRVFGVEPSDLLESRGSAASAVRRAEPAAPVQAPESRRKDKAGSAGPEGGRERGRPRPCPADLKAARPELPETPNLARPLEDLESDPVIREALEEWRGRLRLEDLDMERWLGDRERGGCSSS